MHICVRHTKYLGRRKRRRRRRGGHLIKSGT